MAPTALVVRRAWAGFWRLRARSRAWATKDVRCRLGGLGPLELAHLALFLWGLLGREGAVPDAGIVVGYVVVVLLVVLLVDLRAFWRRERRFFVAAAREVVLATCAIYVDSVATYMVAVTNEHRKQNIELQDNVQRLLKTLLAEGRALELAFAALPELVAAEAIFHAVCLGVAVILRASDSEELSVLAVLAKASKAMRWCRLLRVACYVATVMPSQANDCFANRYDETYSLREHFREAVAHWRVGGGCNDLIYSGHGVVLSLTALLYRDFAAAAGAGAALPLWLYGRLGHAALRIIYARMHMSVDLVVSLAVTHLVWATLPLPGSEVVARVSGERREPLDLEAPAAAAAAVVELDARARRAIRQWMWITVGTALAGFGLLVVNANEAGPISEFNLERLRRIAPGEPAAGRPQRLLCAMLHIENSASARSAYAQAVSHTWGSRCDGLLMWDERRADVAPLDLAASRLEPGDATHAGDRWLRVRRMLRHLSGSASARFDWFVFVDDGGFVFPQNFLRAAATLEHAHSAGRGGARGAFYVAGGWGFGANAAALAELVRALDGDGGGCPKPSMAVSGSRYLSFHTFVDRCLASRGVQAAAWHVDGEVRRALGCGQDAEDVALNLKAASTGVCRHAVLAFMVPTPGWMYDIDAALYPPSP